MSIATELSKIVNSKADIKSAITEKTGTDAGDVLSSYADLIRGIKTGGINFNWDTDYASNYDINPAEIEDEEYPDLTGFVPEEGTIYQIYKTTESNDVFGITLYGTTSTYEPVLVEQGTITNGAFVCEKTVETFNINSSANNFYRTFTDVQHKYTVIKYSATTTNFKSWYIGWSTTIDNVSGKYYDFRTSNIYRLIEIRASIPYYNDNPNTNYTKGSRKWTERMYVYDYGKYTNPTTIQAVFAGMYCLRDWKMINANTSNVSTLLDMFNGCNAIKEIDLTSLDLSKVVNLASAFGACNNLQTLKLGTLGTLTNIDSAFQGCNNLETIEGIEDFNTDNITTFNAVFNNCKSLKSLDLSKWNITSKCTNMANTFGGCYNLTELKLGTLDCSNVISFYNLFNSCNQLEFDDDLVEKLENCGVSSKCTNYYRCFCSCYKLQEIDLSKWDFTNATTIGQLVYYCYNLKSIKLPTSTMTYTGSLDMNQMFNACWSLKEVDLSTLSGITTANIQNCFSSCFSLKKITLFNNVVKLNAGHNGSMFNYCYSLVELNNFENIDTTDATNLANLFNECYMLESINTSNLNFGANLTTANSLFYNCQSLKELELKGTFASTKCYDMLQNLVGGCTSLKKFTFPYTYTIGTTASGMCTYCYSLKELNMPNVDFSKITNTGNMFTYMYCISTLNLNSYPSINFTINNYTHLTETELVKMLNALPTVSAARTLTLGTDILYALTDTDKAIATNKGWTLA